MAAEVIASFSFDSFCAEEVPSSGFPVMPGLSCAADSSAAQSRFAGCWPGSIVKGWLKGTVDFISKVAFRADGSSNRVMHRSATSSL